MAKSKKLLSEMTEAVRIKELLKIAKDNQAKIDKAITSDLKELGVNLPVGKKSALDGRSLSKKASLGHGLWGIVFPTNDKRFVVKITADPTEGAVTQTVIDHPKLRYHPGIAFFVSIRRLPVPGQSPVWIVLRENIRPVSKEEISTITDNRIWNDTLKPFILASRELNDVLAKGKAGAKLDEACLAFIQTHARLKDVKGFKEIASLVHAYFDVATGALGDVHMGNVAYRQHAMTGIDKRLKTSKTNYILMDLGVSYVHNKPAVPYLKNPCEQVL